MTTIIYFFKKKNTNGIKIYIYHFINNVTVINIKMVQFK